MELSYCIVILIVEFYLCVYCQIGDKYVLDVFFKKIETSSRNLIYVACFLPLMKLESTCLFFY